VRGATGDFKKKKKKKGENLGGGLRRAGGGGGQGGWRARGGEGRWQGALDCEGWGGGGGGKTGQADLALFSLDFEHRLVRGWWRAAQGNCGTPGRGGWPRLA